MPTEIVVDGVRYIREAPRPTGNRRVLVISEGWIIAGDVTIEGDMWLLDRAAMVSKWIGEQWFAGVIANPKQDVVLKPFDQRVEVPSGAILFDVVVPDDWGL